MAKKIIFNKTLKSYYYEKILLYLTTAFLTAHLAAAQVLYTEDFDNLTVGNVGTDITGQTPGQGGWYTKAGFSGNGDLSDFQIIAESGRGNIMQINNHQKTGFSNRLEKEDISIGWINRITGNNVYKFEYDFFVVDNNRFTATGLSILRGNDVAFLSIATIGQTKVLKVGCNSCISRSFASIPSFPHNTWVRIIIYIDYSTHKLYFTIPSLGILEKGDLLPQATMNTDWIPSKIIIFNGNSSEPYKEKIDKYDNFMTSAVKQVPLAVDDFISNKFNLFPNPTAEVVTITNNENIGIEKVDVYDLTGKKIKTKKYGNENNIQLNLADIATGTYLLHIQTKEGTAVKKIVKK